MLGHEAGLLWKGGSRGPDAQGGMQDLQSRVLKVRLNRQE